MPKSLGVLDVDLLAALKRFEIGELALRTASPNNLSDRGRLAYSVRCILDTGATQRDVADRLNDAFAQGIRHASGQLWHEERSGRPVEVGGIDGRCNG